MHPVKRYYPVYWFTIRDNIKRLNVAALVVRYRYDTAALNTVIVYAVHRVFKINLINAVTFFGYYARNTIPEAAKSVINKRGLCIFV